MADDIEQPEEPQEEELLAEIEADAEQAAEGLAAAPEPAVQEAPEEALKDMADATAFAEQEAEIDVNAAGDVDALPGGELPAADAPEPAPSDLDQGALAEPPAGAEQVLADMADATESAAAEAQIELPDDVPAALEALDGSEDAARESLRMPLPRTDAEKVRQSIPVQRQHQFEMDYGAPEASQVDMDHFEAQSRYLDVDFMWKRLMTQKFVDMTHLMEQLLAMLERER